MAFRYLAGPEPVIREYKMTDSEGATFGQVLKFSSGRLTSVGDATAPAAIAMETVTAGTDVMCAVMMIAPGMLFEADLSGTATYSASIIGVSGYDMYTGDCSVDLDDTTGGKIVIVGPGSSSTKAIVSFNTTAFWG